MADEFYSLVTDIGAIKQLESVRDGVPFDVMKSHLGTVTEVITPLKQIKLLFVMKYGEDSLKNVNGLITNFIV